MKKMFLALAVLALAIVLLPMQEAKANYHRGDTCPKCGQNKISTFWGTTKLHNVWCSNCHWGQESNGDGTWTTLESNREPHFGGTATCVKEAKCEGCNSTYGEIDPNNHTNLETFAAKEPTCTESGNNLYYYCKDCKKYLKADKKTETTVEKETIKAFHDWATTLTDGGDTHYYACSRCDAKKDEAAHSYGSWTKVDDETHEGTCVCGAKTTGEHVWNGSHWCGYPRKCSVCQEYYGETLGHEFWYEYKTEEQHKINCYHCDGLFGREDHSGGTATCTKKAVCEKCGEEYGDYAHDWGEWHVDPDDSTKHIRTCNNNCGASESHAISWGAWEKVDEENHKHTCQGGCGLSETVAHVWNGSHWCGYPRKCRDCGEFYGDVLDHEFWYEYKTEEQHKINCYHCDGLFGREDHSGGTATCTQKAVCEKCGHEYGALAEHTGGTATCTEKAKCEVCGQEYGEPLGHDLIHHDAQAPTCTAIGWDAYNTCSRCDYTTYEEKAALGHDPVHHDAQAPTCTAIGWDAYQTCSRCDYTTYVEKPALGHSEVTGTAIAPTCTDNGLTEGMYCFRCGQVLIAQEDIPALGHDFAVTHRTITRVYFQCSRCRDSYWIDNAKSRNLLPGLVWDDRDENVEYTAGVAKANGIKVLTITPDAEAVEDSAWVSLRLKPGDVEQWKREGIGTVAFQCGEVRMEISLSALTLDWFDLNEPFDYYVFTLAPEEDGTLVTVEAEIGTEKVAADEYDGITLVRGDTILEIVQNGIY